MTKVAIFTEGQTEQIFACHAIEQLAGDASYFVSNLRKNGKGEKLIKMDCGTIGDKDAHEIYFQILNCDSDTQVLSTIREEYETLVAAGFNHIIGIRDLYPAPKDKLQKILENIAKYEPAGDLKPLWIISIMEIEAWLIAENTHFPKIDAQLTVAKIKADTGIDVTVDSEDFEHPAATLNAIYELVGRSWGKDKAQVEITVGAIEIAEYDGAAGNRAKTIVPLLKRLESIFN